MLVPLIRMVRSMWADAEDVPVAEPLRFLSTVMVAVALLVPVAVPARSVSALTTSMEAVTLDVPVAVPEMFRMRMSPGTVTAGFHGNG